MEGRLDKVPEKPNVSAAAKESYVQKLQFVETSLRGTFVKVGCLRTPAPTIIFFIDLSDNYVHNQTDWSLSLQDLKNRQRESCQ